MSIHPYIIRKYDNIFSNKMSIDSILFVTQIFIKNILDGEFYGMTVLVDAGNARNMQKKQKNRIVGYKMHLFLWMSVSPPAYTLFAILIPT